MLRTSAALFAFGLLSAAFGLENWAGIPFETGQLLMGVMTSLAILTFIAALVIADRKDSEHRPPAPGSTLEMGP